MVTLYHVGGHSADESRRWIYSFDSMRDAAEFMHQVTSLREHPLEYVARQASQIEWRLMPQTSTEPDDALELFLNDLKGV